MQNILIPTDFSDNANKAIRYAILLFGVECNYTLVNGYEVPHSGSSMLISIADILEKDALHLLNATKDKLITEFPELQTRVTVKAVMGVPGVVIRKMVEKEPFDAVVMGTKGASGLKEVLIGSVTSKVLDEVNIPVIAVPESTRLNMPKQIVFAADDTFLSQGQLPETLCELLQKWDAQLLLLNVVPKGESSHVGNSNTRPPRFKQNEKEYDVYFVESEDVNKGIEQFIRSKGADMLAMVNRKNDLVARLFGTSNTKKMIMHTHIPLLAFKQTSP